MIIASCFGIFPLQIEDDLELLLRGMKPANAPALVIRRLQLVIVAIDANWTSINAEAKIRIIRSILELLNSEDTSILEWVFVCMSNLSYVSSSLYLSWIILLIKLTIHSTCRLIRTGFRFLPPQNPT